jgi:hypothetical protein
MMSDELRLAILITLTDQPIQTTSNWVTLSCRVRYAHLVDKLSTLRFTRRSQKYLLCAAVIRKKLIMRTVVPIENDHPSV